MTCRNYKTFSHTFFYMNFHYLIPSLSMVRIIHYPLSSTHFNPSVLFPEVDFLTFCIIFESDVVYIRERKSENTPIRVSDRLTKHCIYVIVENFNNTSPVVTFDNGPCGCPRRKRWSSFPIFESLGIVIYLMSIGRQSVSVYFHLHGTRVKSIFNEYRSYTEVVLTNPFSIVRIRTR